MFKKLGLGCLGLVGVVVVIIIIVAVATSGGGSSSSDTASKPASTSSDKSPAPTKSKPAAKPTPKPKAAAPKADMKVKAGKILKDFDDNEAAADAKYKGKTLRVTGIVGKVDTEMFDGDQYVIQLGTGSDYEITYVNCNDIPASVAAKVKKGSKVSVVGAFDDGGDLGVELKDCGLAKG